MGRINRVREILNSQLQIKHLDIVDESHQHSGNGQATHLKLMIVAADFDGLNSVKRQQLIYRLLDSELKAGLHALTMRTMTIAEWDKAGQIDTSVSPPCHGGSKRS